VLDWYQDKGMRSHAERGVACDLPVMGVSRCAIEDAEMGGHTMSRAAVEEYLCYLRRIVRDCDCVFIASTRAASRKTSMACHVAPRGCVCLLAANVGRLK
jgi:hypothetical protein